MIGEYCITHGDQKKIQEENPNASRTAAGHHWLQKLVGEWAFEGECSMGRDQPAIKNTGTEIVRSLGGLWTIGEGSGEMPDGGICQSIMTLAMIPR